MAREALWSIVRLAGQAPFRFRPLSSHVRSFKRLLALLLRLPLHVLAADGQDPVLVELISRAQRNPSSKEALIRHLLKTKIIYIADKVPSENVSVATEFSVRIFNSKGRDFIPVFTDEAQFKGQAAGTSHEGNGIRVSARGFFSKLTGTETIVLNPASSQTIVFIASELKSQIVYTAEEQKLLKQAQPKK